MNTEPTQLVVIVCEQALEALLAPELLAAGAKGYTVCEARGRGNRGVRDARWLLSSNLRIEILCRESVARRIMEMVDAKYCENFGLVMYRHDVQASRAEKF
ncbi:P-II family nitrogen regulator [Caldimonas tepidiphila]|uniref:P-II family nitrogen regulator n=1 Tax=Caldimonas tepidiphila TaxID=2315841 RepID=UPI000E5C5157|nr:transcriptional regulator [Caldimonas tepidiphila]